MSMPSTRPEGLTARAIARLVSPQPQPTSSTRSPGCAPSTASARAPCAPICTSMRSCIATQMGPACSFQ
jgi:hypothetical protein